MASAGSVNWVTEKDVSRSTPADLGVAAATALGLVVWNNVFAARPWHARHYVLGNLMGTAALFTVAHQRGASAHELGLSSRRVAAGARAGVAVSAPIMVIWALAALPPNRGRIRDARLVGLTPRAIAYHAAVRVPLGTAVWEEMAFRAVLPVLLRRVMPARTASAVNAVVFGLWHVRPTLDVVRLNGIATSRFRRSAAAAGAVVAGALVDVLFSSLRRSCGSLLGPTLVHIGSNSGGTVAAAVSGPARPRRDSGGHGPTPHAEPAACLACHSSVRLAWTSDGITVGRAGSGRFRRVVGTEDCS